MNWYIYWRSSTGKNTLEQFSDHDGFAKRRAELEDPDLDIEYFQYGQLMPEGFKYKGHSIREYFY